MFPTNQEFSILYICYLVALILIIRSLFFNSKNNEFKFHFLFYVIYTGFMIYIFSDEENFSGGNSLAILVYGFLFLIAHLIIFGILKLILIIRNTIKVAKNVS